MNTDFAAVLPDNVCLKGIDVIQQEIDDWAKKLFGDNESKVTGQKLYSQNSLTGATEELGEWYEATASDGDANAHILEILRGLARVHKATICRHQGRRGYDKDETYQKNRNDAVADFMIFVLNYCAIEKVDLLRIVNETWNMVQQRTLKNWEKIGHDKPAGEPLEQNGQGFAEPAVEPIDMSGWQKLHSMVCAVCGDSALVCPPELDRTSRGCLGCATCNGTAFSDDRNSFITQGEWDKRQRATLIPVSQEIGERFLKEGTETPTNAPKASADDKWSLAREVVDNWLEGQPRAQAMRMIDNREKAEKGQ